MKVKYLLMLVGLVLTATLTACNAPTPVKVKVLEPSWYTAVEVTQNGNTHWVNASGKDWEPQKPEIPTGASETGKTRAHYWVYFLPIGTTQAWNNPPVAYNTATKKDWLTYQNSAKCYVLYFDKDAVSAVLAQQQHASDIDEVSCP
jgi:hypothetical protein